MTSEDQRLEAGTSSAAPPGWARWQWLWSATFYVTLAAAVAVAVPDAQGSDRAWVIGLAVAAAAWYGIGFRIGFDCWDERRPAVALLYVGGTWALWLALTARYEGFDIVAIGLYAQTFLVLPLRYAIGAVVLLTGVLLFRDLAIDGDSPGLWLVGVVAPLPIMVGLAFLIQAIFRQSEQRRELIQQLRATRHELAEREREAGSLAERQRLAGEIHDTLAQGFATIVMHLEAAEEALVRQPQRSKENIGQARKIARESLVEARRLVWTLKPDVLADSSLPEAVQRLADQWSANSGIRTEAIVTGEIRPLDPAVEVALYRALQEGLSNAAKHAAADSVTITLSYLDEVVALDIQDNGRGIDQAAGSREPGSGFGLQNLRERVVSLGGSLSVEGAPGLGATMAVQIPLAGRLGQA